MTTSQFYAISCDQKSGITIFLGKRHKSTLFSYHNKKNNTKKWRLSVAYTKILKDIFFSTYT